MKQKSGSSSSSASFSSPAGASPRKPKLSLALTYHKALSPWFWLNVVPFVLGYAAVLTAYFLHMDEDKDALWLLGLPVLFVLHVLSFLAMHWSVNARCFFAYRKVSDVRKADFVRVAPPAAHKGPTMLCALHRQVESEDGEEGERLWFIYQQRTFVFDQGEGRFRKLHFPVSGQLEVYQSVKGHTTAGDLHRAQRKWQQNDFQIPLPSFAELFKEQALAPFFVFQVFCVCLWFFDAYWYFSLLTLVMLVVFESSVVQTRIQNLKVLREMAEMAKPKQNMFVYREGKWTQVSAKELLPGDICSLVRLNDETICPCDVLLLSGSCVVDEAMLTGESTPQLKESIQYRNGDENFNISNSTDHIHVIFGGTTIVQASAVSKTEENYRLRAPDGGCIVYVLRTGFYTSQGKLMRTIMFSSERVTANTLETFLFIGCLLCFAIAASGYVLYKGLQDESRSRWKLFLECALVITSVVPPELPTELSLAVNTSLVALRRLGIFCTEPFRIPFAGKVQICCFDKTGTLTSDKLILEGVAGLDDPLTLKDPKELDWEQTLAIAGCHSLVYLNGKQVGDPMEVAALEGINWSYTKGEVSVGRSHGRPGQVRIVRRFHFTSELKRMATVVSLDHESASTLMVTAKGAPETMQPFFTEVPSHYTQTYKHYSRKGFRVIAVGYKPMSYVNASKLNAIPREAIECDLTFAGFLVFKSILKKESLVTMRALIQASHMVTMITGDNTLTACQVATELDILKKPVLILTIQQEGGKEKAYWVSVDETVRLPFEGAKGRMLPLPMSKKALQQLRKNGVENAEEVIAKAEDGYELCLSGQALDWLQQTNRPVREWKQLVPQVSVWARVSPQHKQLIVAKMKSFGYTTLMCGDGTNDVGALKQAHVGVALLTSSNEGSSKTKTSGEGAASASSSDRSTTSKSAKAGPSASLKQRKGAKHKRPSASSSSASSSSPSVSKKKRPTGAANLTLAALLEEQEEGFQPVRIGDASIASPFTAKSTSVLPVIDIIRQGRCTLVTTMQMFKILALNCVINAYSLSVLYLDGIRLGDIQATAAGMLIALCFLFISQSKPLSRLAPQRPPSSVFSLSIVLSLIGQVIIHLSSLIYISQQAHLYSDAAEQPVDVNSLALEEETASSASSGAEEEALFTPNIVNTAVFLISTTMQVATFAVNYRGRPFMEGLTENKALMYGLGATAGFTFLAATQLVPPFNEFLELVLLPPALQSTLLTVMFADLGLAFLWNRIVVFLFS